MKKTATITFHAPHNCGSMLQSYALQKILQRMGYQNEIIDFSNEGQQYMYAFFRKPKKMRDILYNAAKLFYYRKFRTHYKDYEHFLSNYLDLTEESYSNASQLEVLEEKYDAFLTGSDQVWNTATTDFDDAYFLSFVKNKKKIAYATSFGTTRIVETMEGYARYKEYMEDLDYISIRENNGARWIEEMIGRKPEVLLDPTMVLKKEDYVDLLRQVQNPKEKYIFYYAFHYSDEVNTTVKRISEELGMPVYILDAKSWVKIAKKYGFKLTKNSGPIAFLNYLFHAELVLTTSFHGTVFSILGKKKFWFIDSTMHNESDDRTQTILDMLDLSHRMKAGKDITKERVLEEIDYTQADLLLEEKRKASLNFLKMALAE